MQSLFSQAFSQARVAASANSFLDGLLGSNSNGRG